MPYDGLKACGYTRQHSSSENIISEFSEVPLKGNDVEAEAEVSSLLMRIVTHDQDTGGLFFVCQKVRVVYGYLLTFNHRFDQPYFRAQRAR